jgi:hypothetical protein
MFGPTNPSLHRRAFAACVIMMIDVIKIRWFLILKNGLLSSWVPGAHTPNFFNLPKIGPIMVPWFAAETHLGRDNLAHGYGTYIPQNGTVYQGLPLRPMSKCLSEFFSSRASAVLVDDTGRFG